jgi:radical SAM superfamily enzyme YgiQ (UPF0313 family)
MRAARCETVYIGFESIDPKNLKSMKKDQSFEEIKSAIKILKKNKIQVHGMFVFGFENDDQNIIKETIHFANRSHIQTVQFLILTPLPGTETFKKLKEAKRIKFFDWTLYDAHHAVFETKNLSIDQLQRAQIKGHQSFYSIRQLLKRALRFEWHQVLIGFYARHINRIWKRKNKTWLKVLELLKPNFNFHISIDVKQIVRLPKKFYTKGAQKVESKQHQNDYLFENLENSNRMAISK